VACAAGRPVKVRCVFARCGTIFLEFGPSLILEVPVCVHPAARLAEIIDNVVFIGGTEVQSQAA
jgi:hypothetical protein